jgi:hypothetical protein
MLNCWMMTPRCLIASQLMTCGADPDDEEKHGPCFICFALIHHILDSPTVQFVDGNFVDRSHYYTAIDSPQIILCCILPVIYPDSCFIPAMTV